MICRWTGEDDVTRRDAVRWCGAKPFWLPALLWMLQDILIPCTSSSFLFLIRPIIRPTFINCTSDFLKYEIHKQFINKKSRYKCIPESVGYHFYYPILLQRFSYSSFLKPPGPFLGGFPSSTSLKDLNKPVKAQISPIIEKIIDN